MRARPVHVFKIHGRCLDSAFIQRKLERRGVALPVAWADRKLDGCLYANVGEGIIFVDGTLGPDDCRRVIAHEFGHYLADYEWPRRRAIRHLGDSIIDVLNGERPPTPPERLAAVLTDVKIGVHVHYMDRFSDQRRDAKVRQVEKTANLVAAELLAPRVTVISEVKRRGTKHDGASIVAVLREQFGLPQEFAGWYAGRLTRQLQKQLSFTEILGLAPMKNRT